MFREYSRCQELKSFVRWNKNFMQVAKKGKTFLIYVLATSNVELPHHEIPSQYKEFKDMFEKKNIDILP